jgi:signal transduction histidine kinase
MLKSAYDKIHDSLQAANLESNEKNKEIAAQNEELIQMQDNLNSLNLNLETMVRDRTAKIQMQNEILMKYSYTNAHDLRGPVARLMGLASISGMDENLKPEYIIEKMRQQAVEIDDVVRKINVELESVNLQFP